VRRIILGCLSVALALAAARAPAQDVRWRSASPGADPQGGGGGFASDRPAPAPGAVGLQRPQPLARGTETDLTPTTFNSGQQGQQTEQLPQPMPVGPGAGTDKGAAPKTLAMPTPLGSTPLGPSDSWGGPVPQWHSGSGFPPQAAAPVPFGVPFAGDGVPQGDGIVGGPVGDCFGDACSGIPCGECCGVWGIPCARNNRFWVGAEYLLWTVKGQPLPPLVTTSANPFGDFPAGALGQPNTSLLFGDARVTHQAFSGARIYGGIWLDQCQTWGLDTSFFLLARQTSDFVAGSNGAMPLFRPFFNTNIPGLNMPGQDAEIVAFPGLLAGTVQVRSATSLWGFDTNLRRSLLRSCNGRLDLLLGYRYLDLEESLQIRESLTALVPAFSSTPGDRIMVTDRFATRNQFNGGQIGLDGEWFLGRWSLGGFTKVALGNVHESVSINGNTVFAPVGGMPITQPGGLLAQGSNIGTFTQNHFAVVPEVGVKVGYRVTDWCRAYVGYNFLYLSDVMRPGDQIDLRLNTAQIPRFGQPPALPIGPPSVPFRQTDFWAQGVNFGLQFTW
jgi:hypothetical protein